MLRTWLIIAAIILAVGAYILAMTMPRRPEMIGGFKVLIGLGFLFALFFAAIRFIDDYPVGYFWWSVPSAAFILPISAGIRGYDAVRKFIRATEQDAGLSVVLQTSDHDGFKSHADLGTFKFTGQGVGFLTHLPDPNQEVGCVVTTPYRGMTLQELVDIAATHQCQHVGAVAA